MFKFGKEQKIYDIAGVKIGGQPGETPTVMIGSIFYIGHPIVTDDRKGEILKDKAEELIKKQEEQTDLTRVPGMLDVVASYPEAMIKFIDFVADVTKMPFLIDSERADTIIAGTKHVGEVGLQDRVVYNSIYKGVSDEEIEALKNSGIKAALLLARNVLDLSTGGKLKVVRDVMKLADKAKVEKRLIDVATEGWGIEIGKAARAIRLIKEEYGLPVGIATGNVTTTFRWPRVNVSKETARVAYGAIHAIMPALGSDYLMYGPIEHAEWAFPAVATIDTYTAVATAEIGIEPADLKEEKHPAFLLMAE